MNARRWLGLGRVLPQTPKDIFDIHYGVIHHHPDGHGQSAERHGIHGNPKPLEGEHCHPETHGNGCEGDEGCPEIQQEQNQHQSDHNGCLDDGFFEISNRIVDEVLLLKKDDGLNALRQAGLEFGESCFHFPG